MRPFERQAEPDQPLLDRALRLPHEAAAEVAVANLFAAKVDVRDIDQTDLHSIAQRLRLESFGELSPALRAIFARLLVHYVSDGEMSDDEVEALVYVKELFDLTNQDARALHDEAAAPRYRAYVDARLADRTLDEADVAFLEQVRERLLLSDERSRSVMAEAAGAILRAAEAEANSGQGLSPTSAAELEQLAARLGVKWPAEGDEERVALMRRYWELDRLPLTPIEVDLELLSGEVAYLHVPRVRWRELRRLSNNEADTLGVVILDLIELFLPVARDWFAIPGTASGEDWFTLDRGSLTFTNRRLRFMGRRGAKTVPLGDIREVEHAAQRLRLRVRGRPWPLVFEGDEPLAAGAVLLRRLAREEAAAEDTS